MSSTKPPKQNHKWKPLTNHFKKPTLSLLFTKKDILAAIKKTPIFHGAHFQSIFENDPAKFHMVKGVGMCIDHKDIFTRVSSKTSKVNVIGAILAQCVLNKKARCIDGNAIGEALKIYGSFYVPYDYSLSRKNYLTAIDSYFEHIDRDLRLSKSEVKSKVISFIKKNFPTRFSMKLSTEYSQFLKA